MLYAMYDAFICDYCMKTIGRVDRADFPEINLRDIKIKIDSGAFTSSIHCHAVHEVDSNGENHIEFKLLDPSHPEYENKVYTVKDYKEKSIKSSNGKTEQRFIIKTTIMIFDEVFPIELSLSERGDMKYPVLLGRKFLNNRFIIDTSLKNVSINLKSKTN